MSDTLIEIKKLGEDIDKRLNQVEERAKNGEKAGEDLKSEIINMVQKDKELREKEMDQFRTEIKKAGTFGGEAKGESFEEFLEKGVKEHKSHVQAKQPFKLEFDGIKAAADMGLGITGATNLAAGILQPNRRNGILTNPGPLVHVRDFITVTPTASPVISYLREGGQVGAPATVAEGALKPQFAFTLSTETANVKKIAGHMRLSEELMEDVPFFTNYITRRGTEALRAVEDQQVLYGDGTGTNLTGLNSFAVAFARPTGLKAVANATIPDIVRAAIAQIRVGRFRASHVMLNPIDVANLELTRDAQGGYLYVNTANQGQVSTIWRLPIIENDEIPVGSFFVGDFVNGAEILDRRQLSVRFYDQDRDNAILNMMTIVIEERIGLMVTRPESFVRGTFTAAATALGAA